MSLSDFTRRMQSKIYHTISKRTYIGLPDLRSWSDAGLYPEFVRRAAQDTRYFATFKRHPAYRSVLEHVSEEQGAHYLEQIQKQWPELISDIEKFKRNDQVGNPIRYTYPLTGEISPTTLRYLKVACDLRHLFGDLTGFHVAEVGVGYGGQILLTDMLWRLGSWTLFDLDPVLLLTSRYLECHMINSVYKPTTLNRFDGETAMFDLAISNYAFSELPRAVQLKYIIKVLSRAKRGYMTMNSGKTADDGRHLTIDELRTHFPTQIILDEVPLTSAENYILVWGV